MNDPKQVGDMAAIGAGGASATITLTDLSNLAGQLTPIFSLLFLMASLAWVFWRMYDRAKYGPKRGRDE